MKLKLYIYHDVPQCPACQSYETGRYVTGELNTWKVLRGLKHGEILKAIPREYCDRFSYDYENCFCCTCGAAWTGIINIKLVSKAQIEKYKALRNITDKDIKDFNEFLDYEESSRGERIKNAKKKSKKQRRERKIKNLMSIITGR